ncbi:MAG: hypothetical protein QME44_01715 [Thermodesulfobacteriota bacterium]|nr:hypothetical protein [Thermodesulfobacteriota bacterium]
MTGTTNYGTEPEKNKWLAGVTGYAGDFGSGGSTQYATEKGLNTQGLLSADDQIATGTPKEVAPSLPSATPATYAAPDTYKAAEPYTPAPAETVEGRMGGLLKKGGAYLDAARTRGLQFASRRGLVNSSIAAEATEKAAIEAALPIAQQDAGYMQNRGLAEQEGVIQSVLSSQGSRQQAGLYGVQGQISSQLSAQEAGQAMNLEQAKQEWTNYRMDVENETKLQISQMEISSNEKKALEGSMATTGETMINQIASIQQNAGINAATKTTIIKQIQDQYVANMKMLTSIYNVQIDWSPITARQEAYTAPTTSTTAPVVSAANDYVPVFRRGFGNYYSTTPPNKEARVSGYALKTDIQSNGTTKKVITPEAWNRL